MLGVGGTVFSREEPPRVMCYLYVGWSALKFYTLVTYGLSRLYAYIEGSLVDIMTSKTARDT